MLVNAGLLIATLIMGLVPLYLTYRFSLRLKQLQTDPGSSTCPPIGIIAPCKGLDPGFRDNILALLNLEYPQYEIVFVVALEEDPAYKAILDILGEYGDEGAGCSAQLLVAGIDNRRAQKLTNQLAAIKGLSDKTEILVFVDSDVRPEPDFLNKLTAPLGEAGVGATTGFRWYHPQTPTMGAILQSTWNAGALPFLVDPERNFAWGGAMAIRRDVFERADIPARWDRAVSDDFPFTLGVRDLGMEVRFVPGCLAISYESSSLRQTLEFTNRQSIISRVYFPTLWWSAAIGHSAANILLLYGLFNLVSWLATNETVYLIGAGCIILLPLQLINANQLFKSIMPLLPQISDELAELRPYYLLAAPLASLLSLINTVYSATTRKITWRGITYELVSPDETVVIRNQSGE